MAFSNPFNPGSGTAPPFLAGRDYELDLFRRSAKAIAAGKSDNLLLTGLRGTGKTVLLDEFSKICMESGLLPIRRPHFSAKHRIPDRFYEALRYDMRSAVAGLSVTRKVTQRIGSIGTRIKPKSVGIQGAFYYEPSYESDPVPFENRLQEYLESNWQVFEKNGYHGVAFLFDEFHTVSDVPEKEHYVLTDLLAAIGELQNGGIHYHLVLSGLPKLSLNLRKARSNSERMFRTMVLKNLDREEARLAISKPLEEYNYRFEDGLIDLILDDTGRYPYFIQFYCREIINLVNRKSITVDDYRKAKPVILKQLDAGFFDARMDGVSGKEEELLHSMARMDSEDLKFGDVVRASGIKKSSLSRYLELLEDRGLIHNHKRGVYRFSLPMLRDYLMRQTA